MKKRKSVDRPKLCVRRYSPEVIDEIIRFANDNPDVPQSVLIERLGISWTLLQIILSGTYFDERPKRPTFTEEEKAQRKAHREERSRARREQRKADAKRRNEKNLRGLKAIADLRRELETPEERADRIMADMPKDLLAS